MAKHNDLENSWTIGDYYVEQIAIYCSCDYCGKPIYEGETFHIIGRDQYHCDKVCESCHEQKVAGE